MFVELYIYEQYNPEMARRNTPKLKHFISIEKKNTYRNEIDNLDIESQTHETKHFSMRSFSTLHILGMTGSMLQKRTKDNFCL
jgi:hypothetical protein